MWYRLNHRSEERRLLETGWSPQKKGLDLHRIPVSIKMVVAIGNQADSPGHGRGGGVPRDERASAYLPDAGSLGVSQFARVGEVVNRSDNHGKQPLG